MNSSVLKLYHNALKNKEFCFIFFYLANGRGDEFIELQLPIPNIIIYPSKSGVFIGYFIEGFFGTKKNRRFLQDIIKRFEKTFLKLSHIGYIKRIKHPPIIDDNTNCHFQMDIIYSLKDFSTILDSLNYQVSKKEKQIENLKIARTLGERKITDDALFDYMRFIAYDFVKTNCKEALTREYLEQIGELGNEILGKTKEQSTIRAKAKSIYNWIMENYNSKGVSNWNYVRKTKDDQELKMTRQEIALKNAKKKAEKTKAKVYKAIEKLKEQKEKITIKNIIKVADVGYTSAQKYLKQAREEGIT
ncbi:hypothetical protein [Caminibacter sp.]